MASERFDLIVIGAGPGGYVAAIRAAQLGLKTACVENQYLGGTCLNVGCIPSKAMLDSSERYRAAKHHLADHGINIGQIELDLKKMQSRRAQVVQKMAGGVGFLFKKNKVTHLAGTGSIPKPGEVAVAAADGTTTTYAADNILIATGSAPIHLGALPFDGKHIVSSTEALTFESVPEDLLVVGGGYIGVEIGSVWNRLGSRVHVLEFADRILPASDRECALALQKRLEKDGIRFQFKTQAKSAKVEGGKVRVAFEEEGGKAGEVVVDRVLVAVGRRPVTDGLGLQNLGVAVNRRGFVEVDDRFATSVKGVYAIGDVIGKIMLAHNAEEEGVAAAEIIAGHKAFVNYAACPAVVYTHPELASVGLTEEQCAERGLKVKVGKFPMLANGRAVGMGEAEGFVKVIGDATTDRILGVHMVAVHASDVIAEATVAMEFAASCEDLARSFHAHPTLPEALKEAAMAVDKRAIHA
ncbi:MAG: dihydrolipoyl dehydrogenase [Phycisphaerae bacterium]